MDVVYETDLTYDFLSALKADVTDKMGWHRHRKAMKDAGYDIGAIEA